MNANIKMCPLHCHRQHRLLTFTCISSLKVKLNASHVCFTYLLCLLFCASLCASVLLKLWNLWLERELHKPHATEFCSCVLTADPTLVVSKQTENTLGQSVMICVYFGQTAPLNRQHHQSTFFGCLWLTVCFYSTPCQWETQQIWRRC